MSTPRAAAARRHPPRGAALAAWQSQFRGALDQENTGNRKTSPMSKVVVYDVDVVFGDCDPAGIVFFPNFSKWMDASSLNFFVKCGVPPWRELVKTTGIIGTPLLEIHTKFQRPATYGERLQIHTSVTEWREKVFIHKHVVKRGDDLICEGAETRAFCVRDPANRERIKAIPVPADIRAMCS
jgi:4-hydroxybenzoyl-CoA thioesterase